MDFSITPKQKEIIDLARTIAQEEIKPASLAIDKSGVIPEGQPWLFQRNTAVPDWIFSP